MANRDSIAALWSRLESWAGEHAPEMLRELNPGASDAEINVLDNAFGHPLPVAYRDSLKVHNGEADGWPSRVFADMGAYHSVEAANNDYNMYLSIAGQVPEFDEAERAEQIESDIISVEGPVRPLTFSPDWLPIMNCNGDVFWALDFAPAEGGNDGQVIQVDLESCYWAVVAPDFHTFLQQYVSELEAGEYTVQEGRPTKEPLSEQELVRDRLIEEAFEQSASKDDLEKKTVGELASVAGYRSGRTKGDRCDLTIKGGDIMLRGSLRGANFNQLLRVTIRVGKPRALGLLAPIHEIVEWELVAQ